MSTEAKRKKQFNEASKRSSFKGWSRCGYIKKTLFATRIADAQWIDNGKVIDLAKFKDMKLAYGGAVKTKAQKAKGWRR